MAYSIRPLEMAGVFAATSSELDTWLAELAEAGPSLDDAAQGLRGSPTLVAQLALFGEEHDGLTRRIQTRTDSALYHGREAVDAYVRGDEEMAEQYGREAGAFSGVRFPPGLVDDPSPLYAPGPVLGPPPVLVEGD